MTAASFIFFLLAFVAVGIGSAVKKRDTTEDYLVASRSVNPWLISLSAVATNNSGFMFIGLIGATYAEGIRAMWLMVGWVAGDWLAWFLVHRRLREQSEQRDSTTIPGFLASGLSRGRVVAAVAGLIVLVFLGLYAAAQLSAGSKALHFVFDWDAAWGAVIGAVIVAAYCFAGGIRASIWTDVAQSIVMICAMLLLFVIALSQIGSFGELWSSLEAIDPSLIVLAPSDYKFGFAGYMLGWMGAGAGVVGQPHVMIRAMAIDSPDHMAKARRIYVTWYAVFSAACIGVGLAARVLIDTPDANFWQWVMQWHFDTELALPVLAGQLLAPVLVGVMLAGVFAATISTADSQILACSAAVTQDIGRIKSLWGVKVATLGVTGLALVMTLFGPPSVFKLVTIAWATLAAGLGPLMVIRVLRLRISAPIAIATMVGGLAGALVWRFGLQWHGDMYDVLPGMAAGFAIYAVASRVLPADKSAND